MTVEVGWLIVVGITSCGTGVAEIVVWLFESVAAADISTVGGGLQAVSSKIRAEMIRCLFMDICNMTSLPKQRYKLGSLFNAPIPSATGIIYFINIWVCEVYDSQNLSDHKHLAVQAISHRLQFGSEHGAQAGWPELPERPSFLISSSLLKNKDIRQGDDL